jgi:peroxiredoxin
MKSASIKIYRLTKAAGWLVFLLSILVSLNACSKPQSASSQPTPASLQATLENPPVKTAAVALPPGDSRPSDQAASTAPAQSSDSAAPAQDPAQIASPTAAAPVEAAPAAGPAEAPQAAIEAKPEIGYKAPDFSLKTLDGQTVSLSNLKGKPALLNYWATWCVPCKEELPLLNQLSQVYGASGLQILTIDAIEQDSVDKVQALVSELGLTLPVLLDQEDQFHSAYDQLFFPTTYFIDADGIIRYIKLGSAPEAEMRSNVEKLINNQF